MINQLSFVTKKLQRNSINEVANKVAKATSEDHDSGTESDDEQTFDETEFPSEMSSEISSGCSVRSRPTSQTSTDTLTCEELPASVDVTATVMTSGNNSSSNIGPQQTAPSAVSDTSSASAGQSYNISQHHHHPRRAPRHNYQLRTPSNCRGAESPLTSDLPYDASSDPVEHHSSEEELETLTGDWSQDNGPPSEKRKWSQVARLSVTDSGSSDDEISVLTTGTQRPVEFRTSPPIEAHKPLRSASPPSKMLSLSTAAALQFRERNNSDRGPIHHHYHHHHGMDGGIGGVTPIIAAPLAIMNGTRAASPRKRHRHTPRPQRPCLDFEKMQQMKNRAVTQWRNGGELSLSFF